MPRVHLTPEGWAYVIVAFGVILAIWFVRELARQARIQRELHRRAEEGQRVRQQEADILEECQIGAMRARRRVH